MSSQDLFHLYGQHARPLAICVAAALLTACAADPMPSTRPADPLRDASGPSDLVTLDSGLTYRDLTLGEGVLVDPQGFVLVRYEGRLPDGRIFDETDDQARLLPLDKLISGWREGLGGMRVGGVRKLVIPPELAYGTAGEPAQAVPPNATLTYVVQLLSVYPASMQTEAGSATQQEPGASNATGTRPNRNRFLGVTPPERRTTTR